MKAANYTCQNCGYDKDRRMLDLHHLDENHRNNEWSNLRCLCVWCHVGHHRGCLVLDVSKIGDLSDVVQKFVKQEIVKRKQEDESKVVRCKGCNIEIGRDTKTQQCPNCYAKSTRKIARPAILLIQKQIDELGYCGTARLYGVSDNAIRKWIRIGIKRGEVAA